jgi:S-methylmethionine-dependent homocysteine/selenocysteine methylase
VCECASALPFAGTASPGPAAARSPLLRDRNTLPPFPSKLDGREKEAALEQVDQATSRYPSYYMINCAHPAHIERALEDQGPWMERIRAVRANASSKSHAELNESPELDAGDPVQLGQQYAQLKQGLTRLNVLGGCCGTDHRHLEQIARACAPLFRTQQEKHRV